MGRVWRFGIPLPDYGWAPASQVGLPSGKPRHSVSFQQGEDVFMVPANILVIPPEEEAVACDASKAGQCGGFVCGVGSSASKHAK